MEDLVGAETRGDDNLTVIKALRNDRPSIANVVAMARAFHAESGEESKFDPMRVTQFLCGLCDGQRGLMVVAIDKFANRVGFVAGHAFQNYITGELMAEETAIYVDPAHRKDGVGDMLLDEFESWAINEQRVKRIRVTAQASLRMAGVARWFKSRGYKEAELSMTKEVMT